MGIFQKIRKGFSSKTRSAWGQIKRVFFWRNLSLDDLSSLEAELYGADFGLEMSRRILHSVRQACRGLSNPQNEEVSAAVRKELRMILEGADSRPELAESGPQICVLVGINGVGKTTTLAKLAYHYKRAGKKVLIGACDTYRAAANEQLLDWTQRLGLEMVKSQMGADSAAVAFDSLKAAQARGKNLLLLDTAGRLHNKEMLLSELVKMANVFQKKAPEVPVQWWLVIDSSLGMNSLEQAKIFHARLNLSGLVVTKLDGTSRGGALVGIYDQLHLPIYYVGLGESADDLIPFDREAYINALFQTDGDHR